MERTLQRALAHIFADSNGWQIRCQCCDFQTGIGTGNGEGLAAVAAAFYRHIGTEQEASEHMEFALGESADLCNLPPFVAGGAQ